ncbi:MAG TPA: CHAT domain-containing protein [Thermoanaerobaculia bacterium]|nr:CHAT domain-containing protein [Thermoanaerobaculia bacterium]
MTGDRCRPLSSRAVLLLAAAVLLAPACREEPATPSPPTRTTDAAAPQRLAAGDHLTRELHAGVVHRYDVELPADRLLRVIALQQGVDLELRLFDPDGGEVTVADRPIGSRGSEELLVAGAGRHRLEVTPYADPGDQVPEGALLGEYELLAEGLPADETTPIRVAAERACEWAVAQSGLAEHTRVLDAFDRCSEGLAAVGDLRRLARAEHDRATELGTQGEATLARHLESLEQAAELYAAAGEPHRALELELSASRALAEQGSPERAVETLRSLISRLDADRDTELLADALGMLGEIHSKGGRWDDALNALERARELPTRPSCAQMNRIAQRAVVFRRIGAFERARGPLDEAIAMGEELGCPSADRSVVLYRRGEIALAAGQLDEAADYATRAVEMSGRRQRATTRLFQGQVAVAAGRLDLAEQALGEARGLYAAARQPRSVAVCDLSLGELARRRGEPAKAVEIYRRSADYARARGDRPIEASALLGTTRTHLLAGDLEPALGSADRALAIVEEMRREPSGRTLRAELLASQHAVYDLRVEVLMRLGREAEAIHACEQARARSLLETLSGEAGELSPRAHRLRDRIDGIEERLLLDPEGSGAEALRRELDELDVELERERAHARPAPPVGRVLSAAEIQRTVDPGDLYLSFHLGDERGYLWLIDRQRIDSFELPARADLERLAHHAHEAAVGSFSTRRQRQEQAARALRQLSDALLSQAADRLAGAERLLVVPEGGLLYVPFAALPLPGGEERLIDRHELVILPSVSTLAEQRRRLAGRKPPAGTLAAVADPVFAVDDERLGDLRGGVRSRRRSGTALSRLPHTAAEVEQILGLLPDGARTHVLSGFDATAAAVRGGGLSGYRYVHLATHAQLSGDDPRLVFSLYAADGTPDPQGSLHSRDLYDLDLPADLVVLSACSTGLGEQIDGEGLVGFTQGFFTAGARRLLVSLWEVSDESTAELMRRFYEAHFARGLPPAAALAAAQRTMSRHERYAAPFHWAGFQLQGEPR